MDAERFAYQQLLPQVNVNKLRAGESQLLLVATDGELYGHHQQYRDFFLEHLTKFGTDRVGMSVTFLGRYLREHPPRRRIRIHDNSSWSCHHGVLRWSIGCECTWGDSSWKPILRQAFDLVSEEVDRIFVAQGGHLFKNSWQALTEYIHVWLGATAEAEFMSGHLKPASQKSEASQALARRLLQAQMYKHQMYTSCAWFFEDVDRIEPKNALAAAAITLKLMGRLLRPGLLQAFELELAKASSQHTKLNAATLYRRGIRRANRSGTISTASQLSSTAAPFPDAIDYLAELADTEVAESQRDDEAVA